MPDNYFFNFNKLSYIKGEKTTGCILCKIVNCEKDIEDLTIYRNKMFLVSLNLYPYNPGHLLIFPLRHVEDIRELSMEENRMLCQMQGHFLNILDISHNPAGYNMGYNMGLVAGGSIKHLHLHIIPRYPNEIGIADLIAGKRVLVEDPGETKKNLLRITDDYFLKNIME